MCLERGQGGAGGHTVQSFGAWVRALGVTQCWVARKCQDHSGRWVVFWLEGRVRLLVSVPQSLAFSKRDSKGGQPATPNWRPQESQPGLWASPCSLSPVGTGRGRKQNTVTLFPQALTCSQGDKNTSTTHLDRGVSVRRGWDLRAEDRPEGGGVGKRSFWKR